jgi:anhydro-N-acetylmuramic acid kinase
VVARARQHPFFKRRPPKTCGREEFGNTTVRAWLKGQSLCANRAPMLLASAVTITADAVAEAIHRWVEPYTRVRSLVLCGGGSRNRTLVRALQDRLMTGWKLVDSGRLGIPAQFVEPAGFALLADETIQARPGNIGRATGGAPAVLGAISLPGGHG